MPVKFINHDNKGQPGESSYTRFFDKKGNPTDLYTKDWGDGQRYFRMEQPGADGESVNVVSWPIEDMPALIKAIQRKYVEVRDAP